MFVGHTAVALAAKPYAPRASLGALLAAAYALDLIWPLLLMAGVETVRIDPGNTAFTPLAFDSYPWSHSLVMALVWSVALGAAYGAIAKDRAGAAWVGALVFSHWVLDFVTHVPDLPLVPGLSTRVGLGMWRNPALTVVVESLMFVAAIAIYWRTTRARSVWGHVSLASFLAFLVWAYVGNLTGPPPPSIQAIIWIGILASALTIAWLAWVDRTRRTV